MLFGSWGLVQLIDPITKFRKDENAVTDTRFLMSASVVDHRERDLDVVRRVADDDSLAKRDESLKGRRLWPHAW